MEALPHRPEQWGLRALEELVANHAELAGDHRFADAGEGRAEPRELRAQQALDGFRIRAASRRVDGHIAIRVAIVVGREGPQEIAP
jgi:hypothetical protein